MTKIDRRDVNDGMLWSELDLEDLRTICSGYTVSEAAQFLCRSGTPNEVAIKARKMGVDLKRD